MRISSNKGGVCRQFMQREGMCIGKLLEAFKFQWLKELRFSGPWARTGLKSKPQFVYPYRWAAFEGRIAGWDKLSIKHQVGVSSGHIRFHINRGGSSSCDTAKRFQIRALPV